MFNFPIKISLKEIKDAAQTIKGNLLHTPTIKSRWLSNLVGAQVFLKLENLQIMGSFKPRGALIKILQLTEEERQRGIVTMSAGNHAQGVAYHAQRLGIPATIVMPINTPLAKIESTEALGATVICFGGNLSESAIKAEELVQEHGMILVHPYDDPAIITGQGTVALEILADQPEIDVLIVPVGGGGLAAGMAIAAKAIKPHISLYGVQSTYCPEMIKELYPQRWFMPPESNMAPVAEGIAVKSPGMITQQILRQYLTDMLAVSDENIEEALFGLMMSGKIISEGAGAAGVAALLQHQHLFVGKNVGIVICGGNIDARVLSSILLRGLVHQRKLVRLNIQIHDAPCVLAKCAQIIGQAGGNIFELYHQRLFNQMTVKMAEIQAVVETKGGQHAEKIIKILQENGFPSKIVE